ncbi:hypothetical protein [Escherichia coli]|uniref:hypothetical protein n=1 Tax=Escherichia coli TaxID=562 RepID=UPI001F05DCDF|nr:hypothetical protein [Escherichia coli]
MAKRTTYNVTEEKNETRTTGYKCQCKTRKTITWTEILGYLIDNYSKDAAEDLMSAKQKD